MQMEIDFFSMNRIFLRTWCEITHGVMPQVYLFAISFYLWIYANENCFLLCGRKKKKILHGVTPQIWVFSLFLSSSTHTSSIPNQYSFVERLGLLSAVRLGSFYGPQLVLRKSFALFDTFPAASILAHICMKVCISVISFFLSYIFAVVCPSSHLISVDPMKLCVGLSRDLERAKQ